MRTRHAIIAIAAITVALVGSSILGPIIAHDSTLIPPCTDEVADSGGICEGVPEWELPACPTEDSEDCYWDATTQGNGQGRSFYQLNGTTYYEGGE